jgi:hypothetical protein
MLNKIKMQLAGEDELTIAKAELDAAYLIIDDLPVDPHDMDEHFWCDPARCYVFEEEEDDTLPK